MTSLIRKLIVAGSAIALGAAIGVPAFASADPSSTPSVAVGANDLPSTGVEDFAYPGAARVEADRKITLIKGDGHIVLADSCDGSPQQIKVWTRNNDSKDVCFRVIGKSGYLAMKITDVWAVETKDHPVTADLTADGGKTHQTVDVEPGHFKAVGEATGSQPTALLELRATG
ncbi:hypothetical protein A8W25_24090 [Streptomyces sp. ERV7]|uniref:hypothetical protein n=1 Tax=Streptomyces sp. ERV7 TaxID=1322334 RepID=UPI0007F38311|nr:hypothetical protein [Streptomyces sp. ERV7]OAR22680.1 hypothetical protein A8W25_24090 [Streptomyces sp. ERV7]